MPFCSEQLCTGGGNEFQNKIFIMHSCGWGMHLQKVGHLIFLGTRCGRGQSFVNKYLYSPIYSRNRVGTKKLRAEETNFQPLALSWICNCSRAWGNNEIRAGLQRYGRGKLISSHYLYPGFAIPFRGWGRPLTTAGIFYHFEKRSTGGGNRFSINICILLFTI
jgi:hypothetical protein